jgi:Tripartite tricarboxylate transporter family receptor
MIEVLALDDSPTRSPIYFPRGPQLEGSDEIFDMLARAFFRRADQPIRQHARGETGTLTAEPANSGLFGTPQGGPLSPLLSNLMLDHSARPPVGPRRPSPPTLCRAGRHVERASAGNGLSGHVSGELFKMMASVDTVHVPYRGEAPALTDLIGGQVQSDIRQLAHIDRAH